MPCATNASTKVRMKNHIYLVARELSPSNQRDVGMERRFKNIWCRVLSEAVKYIDHLGTSVPRTLNQTTFGALKLCALVQAFDILPLAGEMRKFVTHDRTDYNSPIRRRHRKDILKRA